MHLEKGCVRTIHKGVSSRFFGGRGSEGLEGSDSAFFEIRIVVNASIYFSLRDGLDELQFFEKGGGKAVFPIF